MSVRRLKAVDDSRQGSLLAPGYLESEGDPGIQMLVEMARQREIDPWDIDIIEVTDRYLQKLDSRGEMDLPVSGRMFFYAAVLVRLKAEILSRETEESARLPEDLDGDDYWDEGDCGYGDDDWSDSALLSGGKPQLKVLVYPRPERVERRPVTLSDLIQALQRYESVSQRHERQRSESSPVALEECKASAHQEELGKEIELLASEVSRVLAERPVVLFQELLEGGLGRVATFQALVFLAAEGVVELHQERFYGPLRIQAVQEAPEENVG